MATTQLPHRVASDASAGETGALNDPASTTGLFAERLQAWKHMCGYLEDYMSEVAKDQKSQTKDQEKILKSLNHPLKEGHHFDQNLGGVVGMFESLRSNTQAQINLHHETSKNLTSTVLPILERLHSEIKSKAKELEKGAGKGTKAVESARSSSQKYIEMLGQHSASHDTAGTKTTAATDPYVLQKGVLHRLNKQLIEENNNRGDLVAVQNSFQQFEGHVLKTVQTALTQFNQTMGAQADRQKAMYADVAGTATKIPLDFEWAGFVHRNGDKLIDPNAPHRTIDTVSFPNQNHKSTQALIEGSLERKGRGLGALTGFSSGFYAITPAGYLHEFKDNDNFSRDPTPEHSFYLPDCVIGALDGNKFTIKGKDSSGGKLSQKISTSSEYQFKAFSNQDAQQWYSIISSHTNASPASVPTSPVSPTDTKVAPINTQTAATGAVADAATHQTPVSATQASAHQTPISPTQAGTHQTPVSAAPVESHATPTTAIGQAVTTSEPSSAVPQSAHTAAHEPIAPLSSTQQTIPQQAVPEHAQATTAVPATTGSHGTSTVPTTQSTV